MGDTTGSLAEWHKELAVKVHSVSAPSAAHQKELINSKAVDVSSHGYGFSFYPKALMENHTRSIDEFLRALRDGKPTAAMGVRIGTVETIWGAMANPFGRSDTFKGKAREEGDGYYVVFGVDLPGGKYITYSTHEIPTNTQLFPVAGNDSELIQGRGPIDMAVALNNVGKLTTELKIKLYQCYIAHWQKLTASDLVSIERKPLHSAARINRKQLQYSD